MVSGRELNPNLRGGRRECYHHGPLVAVLACGLVELADGLVLVDTVVVLAGGVVVLAGRLVVLADTVVVLAGGLVLADGLTGLNVQAGEFVSAGELGGLAVADVQ